MPNDIANNMADTIHQLEEELEKAKRLLKAAVEDLKFESQCRNCKYQQTGIDNICNGCRCNKYEWRYVDEAQNLLNDEVKDASVNTTYDEVIFGEG